MMKNIRHGLFKNWLSPKMNLVILLISAPLLVFGLENESQWALEDIFGYSLWGLTFLLVFLTLFQILNYLDLTLRLMKGELGSDESQSSFWGNIKELMVDAVPVEKENTILLDHNYDGIHELDNNLPPWWLYGFYTSILIAVFYIGFYHFSPFAISSEEQYNLSMEQAEAEVQAYLDMQSNSVDESNVEILTDTNLIAEGKLAFIENCAACHMDHAGGSMDPPSVGPNLTDEYWLHGGSIKNVFSTIKYGVPEKGMISWQSQIRPADIQKIASFILSVANTHPENEKGPQGEIYKSDSLTVDELN